MERKFRNTGCKPTWIQILFLNSISNFYVRNRISNSRVEFLSRDCNPRTKYFWNYYVQKRLWVENGLGSVSGIWRRHRTRVNSLLYKAGTWEQTMERHLLFFVKNIFFVFQITWRHGTLVKPFPHLQQGSLRSRLCNDIFSFLSTFIFLILTNSILFPT